MTEVEVTPELSCSDCPFRHFNGNEERECWLAERELPRDWKEPRPAWCPLEHGPVLVKLVPLV